MLDIDVLCDVHGKEKVLERAGLEEGVKVVKDGHSGLVSTHSPICPSCVLDVQFVKAHFGLLMQ